MTVPLGIATLLLGVVLLAVLGKLREVRRADFIRTYALPPGLYARLQKRRPGLELKDCQLVGRGLRQFFLAYLKGGRRFVSMPSQVADDLWHEFILYTRHYDLFCRHAFGRFLHHTPAVVLGARREDNTGLRRCWWFACREENIDPRRPSRLPLLFALDTKLAIADGFHYTPDCSAWRRAAEGSGASPYCGGDFGDTNIDGSTDGFGDSGSGDSAGGGAGGDGGCSGGCGGD
jgi:hypothetical protein